MNPPNPGFPPFGSFNTHNFNASPATGFPPSRQSLDDDGDAVMALQRIKRTSSSVASGAPFLRQQQQQPSEYMFQQRAHSLSQSGQRYSVASERMNSVASTSFNDENAQKVFVHRRSDKDVEPVIQPKLSSFRDQREKKDTGDDENKDDELDEDASIKADDDDDDVAVPGALPPLNIGFTTADIVFANGNNREKRRVEVFEYYAKLHKYKEAGRELLYDQQKAELQKKVKVLTVPRNFNTEVATMDDCQDVELFEEEQDIVELRDSELTRLRYWRRVQRNENLKLFYEDSSSIYKEATDGLDRRLEKLKNFFIHQKQLLINLEKDTSEISSSKAPKLYAGFINTDNSTPLDQQIVSIETKDQEEEESNPDSSETDAGASSSTQQTGRGLRLLRAQSALTSAQAPAPAKVLKRKVGRPRKVNNSQTPTPQLEEKIHPSILDGLAPVLTREEFFLIVGDDHPVRHGLSQELASLRGDVSDSDSNTNTDGKKPGRGGNTRGGRVDRDGTSAMNRIMKSYTSPDDLKKEDVDQDLAILRYAMSGRY